MDSRIVPYLLILFFTGCQSHEEAHEALSNRQTEVAERGAEVMPFDLDRSTHIFEKIENGGCQQVVSDDGDGGQIALIRAHLQEEAERFASGDFHDPQMIHGPDMAGIHALVEADERLSVEYSDIEGGGQILYTTEDPEIVQAVHAWFDAQLSDHGRHAQGQ